MIRFDREFLQSIEDLPERFGTIRDKHLAGDASKFVLIFQDIPENWSVRWSIGETLYYFRDVNLFCQDGAWGPIDTSLPYTIPKEIIQRKTVIYFLWKLLISPAEYAHILRGGQDRTIILYGVEDKKLYMKAARVLTNQSKFLPLQVDRARAIVINLLKKMEEIGRPISVLTCGGDLPDLVYEELARSGVSCAIIKPKMYYPSDRELYSKRMSGIIPGYDEIVADMEEIPEIPTADTDFPDKRLEEMKEKFRISFIDLIKTDALLPMFKGKVSFLKYRKMKKILRSGNYGPRAKFVLVKTVIYSALGQQIAGLQR